MPRRAFNRRLGSHQQATQFSAEVLVAPGSVSGRGLQPEWRSTFLHLEMAREPHLQSSNCPQTRLESVLDVA